MIYLDTETCGFHGVAVLIQYAEDNGPIQIHSVWTNPIIDTIKLIERIADDTVIGFNLAFDWFHINKLYNMLILCKDSSLYPEDIIQELAILEPKARDGLCIKPKGCFDLMLHARKGPYQSTMDRGDIRIRRVPTPLAWKLKDELNKRIVLPDLYFARKQDPTQRFEVYDIKNDFDEMDTNFKDIVLKFAPSSALKALAKDALKLEENLVRFFTEVEPHSKPVELGYAPFAMAVGSPSDWKMSWPDVIESHIGHWEYNSLARQYASDDIAYTRGLHKHFSALACGLSESEARDFANSSNWFNKDITSIEPNDDDSVLACMVGAVRWKGYKLNLDKLNQLKIDSEAMIQKDSVLATNPNVAKRVLLSVMDETEKLVITNSTKKEILQEIATWDTPAAKIAQRILEARKAKKKLEVIDKLILAGRFHASFKVIGTLSSRMSGTDGLNAQGIGHDKLLRSCFDLAWEDMTLSGGDFASFEVSIADAEYSDPKLHEDLLKDKKIHALLGQLFFPQYDYDGIIETKGTDDDKYSISKQGVFAILYGGEGYTLHNRLGISVDDAEAAYQAVIKMYPGIGIARKRIADKFCALTQAGGIGTKIEYKQPDDYIESMLGFRRYFTLENKIIKILFDLAQDPPSHWKDVKIKVVRRDRQQTVQGATQSSLYGAAFALQSANMRAAGNHKIQSTGAEITKYVERKIWDLQPIGVYKWLVLPMNIHDEIMTPTTIPDEVEKVVSESVEHFRPIIPLIKIDWTKELKTWADK